MFGEFYYWLYEYRKKSKSNNTPGFDAFLGVSFLQCMNVLILFGVANYFLAIDISKNLATYAGIFLYISITVVNYFNLIRKKDEIIKKCEKLSTQRQSRGKLHFWLYTLITLGLFIYVITNLVTPK